MPLAKERRAFQHCDVARAVGLEFAGKLYPADGPVQLLLQRLGPETSGPTRAHIDIGTDDIDAEVARAVSLGAERLWPGDGWYALRDPTGLIFCVTGNSPEAAVR